MAHKRINASQESCSFNCLCIILKTQQKLKNDLKFEFFFSKSNPQIIIIYHNKFAFSFLTSLSLLQNSAVLQISFATKRNLKLTRMDEIRRRLTGQEKEPNLVDELCPSLSFKQRLIGFGICFGIGLLLSFLVSFFCCHSLN